MSRPRVIKNNDGVAVVEGTPAASLVKDVNKFFATRPPERMAGESISQPRKLVSRDMSNETRGRRPSFKDLAVEKQAEVTARREKQSGERREKAKAVDLSSRRDLIDERRTTGERPIGKPSNRNEAKDRAETRRRKFFERRRSKKEAERSQNEQEATKGRFITTLKT